MSEIPVEIVRSSRRKRTAAASMRDGKLQVLLPGGLSPEKEEDLIAALVARVQRKLGSAHVDLGRRAAELARRYSLRQPGEIRWSDRQMKRWGSCSPAEGRIRISNRLAGMPAWVLDSVIVHELAHLEVSDHGPRFQALVGRYELTERARGYLMAKSESSAV
jgi:predicted metal-dependent hydrolase